LEKEFLTWGFFRFYPDKNCKRLKYKKDSFWATVDIDQQITDYYFNLLKNEYPNIKKSDRKPHITVCKGEKIRYFRNELKYLSKKIKNYETRCITFTYSNKIETNGTHFFIKVKSSEIINFRKYLGLSERLKNEFHITIAKIEE